MSFYDSEQSTEDLNESFNFEKTNSITHSVSNILKQLIEQSEPSDKPAEKSEDAYKIFHSKRVPTITLEEYLKRIIKFTDIEEPSLICSLIYIDRLCSYNNITLNGHNIHKILFTSIFLAIKYNEDQVFDIDFYSKVAGVTKKNLIKLESTFVDLVEFNLFIQQDEYQKYEKFLSLAIQK